MPSSQYWIDHLNLQPHPEGGFFRETYRAPLLFPQSALPVTFRGSRCASTAIYFLLAGQDFSALHRLAADEVWHFYAGSALLIHIINSDGKYSVVKLGQNQLGQNSEAGEQFQCVVPAGHWFGSCLDGEDGYALVGCTVAPGFDFADFEMGSRDELLARYPEHREVILRLTRA